MSDVYLYQSDDGGTLNVSGGVVEMRDGLETAVYLSLFGGNEDDPGSLPSRESWWANVLEQDTTRHQRSETQFLLRSLPATTGNLKRLRDAVDRDLAWLAATGVASEVVPEIAVEGRSRVRITVEITVGDETFSFAFTRAWQAQVTTQ